MADISYTPTTWADGAEGGTPIDAAKLNNIEQGIVDAVAAIGPNDTTEDGTLKAQIDAINTSLPSLLHVEQLSKTIASGNVSVSATAPSVTGYTFLTWIMAVPHDWNGYVFVESPLNIVSNIYVENATSGNRTIYCVALYIRS